MELRVVSPNNNLSDADLGRIEQDLNKIGQRLKRVENYKEVRAEIRISENGGTQHKVTIELRYGRNHLVAKSENDKIGAAVREARDELLRQINDRKRGGHSSLAKGL